MILHDKEIRRLCEAKPSLVEGMANPDAQLQPGGVDLTLRGVLRVTGRGEVRRGEGANVRANTVKVGDNTGLFELEQGHYIIELNEIVHLPNDVLGLVFLRSTLIRYGAVLASGVWDPGFEGRSSCGLIVAGAQGLAIERDAAVVQMVFFQLKASSSGFAFNHLHSCSDSEI